MLLLIMMMMTTMMTMIMMIMMMMRQVELGLEGWCWQRPRRARTSSEMPRHTHVSTTLEPEHLAQVTCKCLLDHHCMLEVNMLEVNMLEVNDSSSHNLRPDEVVRTV